MDEARILGELETPEPVRGLAWDGEALWVTAAGSGKILRLDPGSAEVLASVELPEGGSPAGLAWTTRGERPALWQALQETGMAVELDPEGGAERRRLSLPEEGWTLRGLTSDGAAGPTLWFVEARGDGEEAAARAARIDVRDGEVHKRLVLALDATGLAWDGRWLWHGRSATRRLVRVDPMFADATFVLETDFSPLGLVFDGEALWAADGEGPRLVRIARPAARD